jgi:superfamily I DNA/RNA helicase
MARPTKIIQRVINQYIAFHSSKRDQLGLKPERLDSQRVDDISDSLLTTFKVRETVDDKWIDRVRDESAVIPDQLGVLDMVEANKHIYFEGTAGTGKSVLLAEAARRSAKSGKNTLVTCWNVLMAEDLNKQCGGRPNATVIDINTLMLRYAALEKNPDDAKHNWYVEVLPKIALEAIESGSDIERFDSVIVDEFQDISEHTNVLAFLLALCRDDNTSKTKLIFAGDRRQQIMVPGRGHKDPFDVAKFLVEDFFLVSLSMNCRMSPELAQAIDKKFGFEISNLRHRLPARPGNPLRIVEVASGQEVEALLDAIEQLLLTYRQQDIRILSPFSAAHSLAGRIVATTDITPTVEKLQQILRSEKSTGMVRWRSISKYKGLDADAVIITDIHPGAVEWGQKNGKTIRDLLYVGATRAKYELVVLTEAGVL